MGGFGGENTLVCADPDQQTKELFLPFRCFCTRKDVSDYIYKYIFIKIHAYIYTNNYEMMNRSMQKTSY